MSPRSFAGFVACGGQSRRMGRDKALLPFGESDLLAHAIERLRDAGADPVVLLCGAQPRYGDRGLPLLLDVTSDAGPLAGLLAGLESLAVPEDVALILAVDSPHVPASLLAALAREALSPDPVDRPALVESGPAAGLPPDGAHLRGLRDPQVQESGASDHGSRQILSSVGRSGDLPPRPDGLPPLRYGFDVVVPVGPSGPEPLIAAYRARCAPAIRARLAAGERRMTCFWPDVQVRELDSEWLSRFGSPERLLANWNSPAETSPDANRS